MLLFAALLVSVEVIARKILLLPFNAGTELAMYSLAVGASFAFANTLLEKAHVRIDIIHRLLPQEGRVVLDLIAMISLAGFAGLLAWYAGGTALTSFDMGARENTPLATPLALPQGLWFVGLAWLTLVAVQKTLATLLAIAKGDSARAREIAGPADFDTEMTEAVSAVEARANRPGSSL